MKNCKWHKGDTPIRDEFEALCPNCGKMIITRTCDNCKETFLDWQSNLIDDVMSPPSSYNGDFMCQSCALWAFQREEQDI